MLNRLGVYRHDHREDLLVAITDEGTLILPPGVEASPCGMCGNDAYVMVCPPMTHFEFAQPSWLCGRIPNRGRRYWLCGQGCLDRFKVLLRLDDGPTAEAL